MDLKAFSGESFDAKDWINQTFKQPEAIQNKEQYASNLVMKLQLLISKLNTSIEDQSDAVVQNIPKIVREIESLQNEATILQTKMTTVQTEIDRVNRETGTSMETLVKLDKLKGRILMTSTALKEADNWTTLSAEIEDALDSGEIEVISEKLCGIQASLKILSHVPDYDDRVCHVESLKNRLEALASPQVVAAFNSSDEVKAKFFVQIFNGMERGSQLLKYFRKCLKARLIKDWERIVEDNQHLGALEWCETFFSQLEQTLGSQFQWFKNVFPSENPSENMIQTLVEVYSGLDPKMDFCLESSLKQHSDDTLGYLIQVKQAISRHCRFLEELLGQGENDASSRELGQLLFQPFKLHTAKYGQYEATRLQLELESNTQTSKDIIDELRNVTGSVNKLMEAFTEASRRCCDLTEGCAYPALVGTLEDGLSSYLSRFTSLMRRLDKRKTSSHSWAIFQNSLTLNQAVGDLLLHLEQLDITLSIDFLERTKVFLGSSHDSHPSAFEQFHLFLLDSGAMLKLDTFYEKVKQGSNYPILAKCLKLVSKVCAELQLTTFTIIFHPIQEELNMVSDLELWKSASAGSDSTEQDMPDFSFSPHEYITQIGQYLMTLPQHLEPYMTNENPALARAFQERVFPYCSGIGENCEQNPADFILACITQASCDTYQGVILKIPTLSTNSTKQLACDVAYLGDILEDLGHCLSDGLKNILTLLKLPAKDYWVASTGCPQKMVSTIRQMRNLGNTK
ncbi:conserved oligomeric Golgi complex subunit 7-like [Tigriopus californicus]|uniref:conserved oligomeric Golgi complex subunit 7-like n=1 Tax=Tigriopus californicus TaxID=6832 RepID=UPI0027DAB0A9|nr:conserved oligomeric Golgi complex subunit 7-like [Tigriopus californicus]